MLTTLTYLLQSKPKWLFVLTFMFDVVMFCGMFVIIGAVAPQFWFFFSALLLANVALLAESYRKRRECERRRAIELSFKGIERAGPPPHERYVELWRDFFNLFLTKIYFICILVGTVARIFI